MSLWNKTDTQASKPKFLSVGQLKAIQVTAGGTGYTPANGTAAAIIAAPPAGGVQATGTVTIIAGVISSVAIDNPGAGYTTAPAITYITAGANAAMTSTIRSVGTTNSGIVFVDETEAQVAANRLKGLKTPGWVEFSEYVDNTGATRYKSNVLIAITTPAATSGDNTDDAIVSDTQFVLSTQPAASSIIGGVATTFVVAGIGANGFQWQMRPAAGGQYANLADAGIYSTVTTATLNLSTGTLKALTGNRYRCVVANTTTGASATSAGVALTVSFGVAVQPTTPTSVVTPGATSFTVGVVESTSIQWQLQTGGVGAWANLTNAGVYTNVTTATLNISNSAGLNTNKYRAVVSDGVTTVNTIEALLTVTV